MRDDALPLGRVLVAGAAIALGVTTAVLAVMWLLRANHLAPGGLPVGQPRPPEAAQPALQTAPQLDLAAYRREKQAALDGTGWVDAASGVAHVPIETAMALSAQRAASEAAP